MSDRPTAVVAHEPEAGLQALGTVPADAMPFHLAAIVDSSDDAILSKGLDGTILSWNRGAERLYGYTAREIVGKSISVLVPDDRSGEVGEILRRVRAGELVDHFETQRVAKDGSVVAVSLTVSPIKDASGKIVAASTIARDTSERRMADQLRFHLAAIVDSSDDAILSKGLDGTILSWNRAAERLYGYTARDVVGKSISVLVPEDRSGEVGEILRRIRAGELVDHFETQRVAKDGSVVPVSLTVSPIKDASGKIVAASTIARDTSERRRLEAELQTSRDRALEAQAQADRANRAKSEFLSRMSHELRTPLNAVLGFAQLLELDGLDERQAESVDHILKGGRHLLGLIDEVLDISRIESGRMALSVEPVHAAGVLGEVLALVKPMAAEWGIELRGELQEADGRLVRADLQRLKQVLLNLLSNAIKYNREGGEVTVSLRKVAGERVNMLVSDTGAGITPDKLDRLFTPFERLGAELTGVEGTGLGLALSKRLTEAMGGSLTVESEPGRGSTFCVELALVEPPKQHAPVASVSEPHAGSSDGSLGQRSLLYIEDNPANFKLVQKLFERDSAIEVSLAMQGELGVELARQHQPHAVILDLHLPDIPGTEVLARLKRDSRTADIPVIVLTADASRGQAERLREAGAYAYVTKPLDVASFRTTVEECLGSRAVGS